MTFNCNSFSKYRRRLSLLIGLGLVAVLGLPGPVHGQEADRARSTQQVAALVDYVAADYPQAVRNGEIVEQSEYAEQQNLLGEARKLAVALGGAAQATLAAQLEAVSAAVGAKASADEVRQRCRVVRQTLKDSFALHMVPAGPVSAGRAAEQFKGLCSSCHGLTGRGDGPAAAALKPPPVSFHDGARMGEVAPSLAFHTLTFGVPGTPMVSFDALPTHERWNLAFYVVALRHGTPGAPAAAPARPEVQSLATPALLAERSDNELLAELTRIGVPAAEQPAALDYLRATAPFAAESQGAGGRFAQARALLSEMLAAAAAGDTANAHRLAIAAYLEGIEPHEAGLRTQMPELLPRIEGAFMALRQLTEPTAGTLDRAELERRVQVATALLAQAEQGHGKATSPVAAFIAALIIALREGLEVALLIAALLAFLRKSGQGQLARIVHLGWLLAIPAGIITFLAVGALVSGAQRELAEAVTTLLAAAILITMTHWIIGAKEARHWLGFLRRRVEAAGTAKTGQALALLGLSFFAAYREAFETVLFFRALILDAGPQSLHLVAAGAASGSLIMVAVVLVVGRIGQKLNPRPVMLVSSAFLALLALSLTGHGIHSLQEGGYLRLSQVLVGGEPLDGLPSLGLYASWEGLLGQLAVVALLLLPWLLQRLRAARPVVASPSRA
ncbi:MAG TPA: FTR1 family protein [Pseudomonadota bacterium]|nr:FTR1 family protein [Pseudomonadota bacterium]